jgi:sirohydrochlorin cobaltochelatase
LLAKQFEKELDMPENVTDKRAPMASAPLKYLADGSVDWGNMWDSFCVLAQEGGPPHRGTMLYAQEDADTQSEGYRLAVDEIIRGIYAVSGLKAAPAGPGWIAVGCPSATMARWLAEAIEQENVQARWSGVLLLLPVGDYYSLKGEIKNVITAVAKTTHYWQEHLPQEVKSTLALQERIEWLKTHLKGWLYTGKTPRFSKEPS